MTTASEELLFNQAYSARIRELRLERGWTADQMATALGVPADRYRKYEVRSPMPLYLVERFALIVARDVSYVVTGKSERQAAPSIQPRMRA
ncbi:MAG: helix-turn-helix domain-containing protein [Bosea sp. (in: a-proteobacteria)]